MKSEKCVLVVGNLTEGYRFIGPFDDFDKACDFSYGIEGENWIASLETPAEQS
jgi:hypothetical protein